ncbi:hypothetical protein K431DRAFT_120324 [Polychaeton citri CBS 116435]|uniref:CHY-type domain-containing protein n=1 Tax=Polychaeton citri CBS 116435 TaxID=1314669 RepID=A0A9P4Q497_9PEZI|nr:hypothetical protein K431DRAFT_120324 [Polychaeton citri CBS 116435]
MGLRQPALTLNIATDRSEEIRKAISKGSRLCSILRAPSPPITHDMAEASDETTVPPPPPAAIPEATAGVANRRQRPKSAQPTCRFFGTKKGCRAGDSCPFAHDATSTQAPSAPPALPGHSSNASNSQQQRRNNPPLVDAAKTVQRPVPQLQREDPRAFQLGQIRRRFKPDESEDGSGTTFKFKMAPSDPDFPYEMDALMCSMDVPTGYPSSGMPTLTVTNPDIPRGFQINIEKGFDTIAATSPDATLLGLMNRLDKQLETILAGKMAETIKIVTHRNKQPAAAPTVESQPYVEEPRHDEFKQSPPRIFTEAEVKQAQERRRTDTRQLEARFGRLQSFSKSSDGSMFQLPLDSPKRSTWPTDLQLLRVFSLLVPESYPLDPPTIHLDSESQHARNVEAAFGQRAASVVNESLTQRMNYLTIHLNDMAKQNPPSKVEVLPAPQPEAGISTEAKAAEGGHATTETPQIIDEDRKHIQLIPRPPEWDIVDPAGQESDSYDDYSYDTGDETEGDDDTQPINLGGPAGPIEKGVLLSFPNLDLHGIELLELVSLGVAVKCERCKETMEIERLKNNVKGDESGLRADSCKKCASSLAVGFRADMIHSSSVRGGYLDLDGCTVVDMLPSAFVPTCSDCSSPHPAPGVISVRGESTMAICRECHRRMTFRINEVKFLQISAAAIRATNAPQRKKVKENLGISAGSNLPRRGRCQHYAKSYRWFRFSCCSKVFPCDRCHDEKTDHPNEHANRMLCGFCSREQNYRPEDCGICRATLTGKAGHGFWEGGRGTRDRAKMSRKDPRKYKRRPVTTSSKK